MENKKLKEQFIIALKNDLPGEKAQLKMAPVGRNRFNTAADKNLAAVLILLFPFENQLQTVFIKRPEYDGPHSGQISYPGGKEEHEDNSLEYTAIREFKEETGFRKEIEILGKLTPLFIPVSGFEVHPYVGFTNEKPKWEPDKQEVEDILEVSLNYLSNDSNTVYEEWNLHGTKVKVPFYRIKENHKLWGATAMITSELIDIYKKLVNSI